jgi:hypothetical protein
MIEAERSFSDKFFDKYIMDINFVGNAAQEQPFCAATKTTKSESDFF